MTYQDHPEYAAFIANILASPKDDIVRVVFADWLDDDRDPDRAVFIRIQVERHRLEQRIKAHQKVGHMCESVSATWCPVCGDCCCPDREVSMNDPHCPLHLNTSLHAGCKAAYEDLLILKRRERELLTSEAAQRWLELPVEVVGTSIDMTDGVLRADTLTKDKQIGIRFEFARGFVSKVTTGVMSFIGRGCERCWSRDQGVIGFCRGCQSGLWITKCTGREIILKHPVESVFFTDINPVQIGGPGSFAGGEKTYNLWSRTHEPMSPHFCPPELYDLIDHPECDPADVGVMVKQWQTSDGHVKPLSKAALKLVRRKVRNFS